MKIFKERMCEFLAAIYNILYTEYYVIQYTLAVHILVHVGLRYGVSPLRCCSIIYKHNIIYSQSVAAFKLHCKESTVSLSAIWPIQKPLSSSTTQTCTCKSHRNIPSDVLQQALREFHQEQGWRLWHAVQ